MPERVLIVDDDRLILVGILRLQKRLVYEFESASGSREALEMIRNSGPFAVVISDWDMPGMDGMEFLRRCREQQPDMVRVMLSGLVQDSIIQQAVEDELLFRFVPKPATPHQVAVHLEAALVEFRRRIPTGC